MTKTDKQDRPAVEGQPAELHDTQLDDIVGGIIRKIPGRLKWGDIVLKRDVTDDGAATDLAAGDASQP